MKKLLLAAFVAVSIISSAFAAPSQTANYFVSNSFKQDFPFVSNVQWTISASFSKATFLLNNIKTEAFYKADGELIGTASAITLDELPTNAKRTFAKRYSSCYIVKEAIKFEGVEETAYYISAADGKESVILKVLNSNMSVYIVSDKNKN